MASLTELAADAAVVAEHDGKLYCVQVGRQSMADAGSEEERPTLWWTVFDPVGGDGTGAGADWAPKRQVDGVEVAQLPSLASFRGQLFLAYQADANAVEDEYGRRELGLVILDEEAETWTPAGHGLGRGVSTPALAVHKDRLHAVYQDKPTDAEAASGEIGVHRLFDGSGWTDAPHLPQELGRTLSLVSYGDVLHLFVNDGAVMHYRAVDGLEFDASGRQVSSPLLDVVRGERVATAVYDGELHIAFSIVFTDEDTPLVRIATHDGTLAPMGPGTAPQASWTERSDLIFRGDPWSPMLPSLATYISFAPNRSPQKRLLLTWTGLSHAVEVERATTIPVDEWESAVAEAEGRAGAAADAYRAAFEVGRPDGERVFVGGTDFSNDGWSRVEHLLGAQICTNDKGQHSIRAVWSGTASYALHSVWLPDTDFRVRGALHLVQEDGASRVSDFDSTRTDDWTSSHGSSWIDLLPGEYTIVLGGGAAKLGGYRQAYLGQETGADVNLRPLRVTVTIS
ncbi:hypothetical protein G3I19_00445 [Streptomyces sp. SID10853]|uniref:hypothetical protein n=1 Tax=Streptomyces sp. SID10853 TaxID=2706028 RepID=UPI0013C01186|nr:hypothetical protein [Streptomyces sp. SID10853]NDZ77014.1 hypothetical protein [Streptomyces sp. SID10853]